MGKLKIVKKVLDLLKQNEDKVAKEVSKRTSKVDEEQVKKGIDKASDLVDERSK
ncbi:MAG: hypothetical protein ABEJ94_01560 [Halorientalis sp.]